MTLDTDNSVRMAQSVQKFFRKAEHLNGKEPLSYQTHSNTKGYRTFDNMGAETPEFEDKLTMEDVLEKLGGFSRFQFCITIVLVMVEIPCAAIALTMIFTGTSNVEFNCLRNNSNFDTISAQDVKICSRNCTLVLNSSKPVVSIVQEWELVCEKAWLPDFFTSIQMAGMTTGALTGSQVADAYGRRTAYYASVALMGIFGFTSGIVTEIYSFAVSRFLAGLGLGGFYGTYYIYLMEFLTPKWRTLVGCVSVWSLGIMILALMAYLIPSWRYLTCIPSLMALVFLCFYPFVPETPRWLLCQQRTAEAQKSLNKIARMNRKPLLDSAVVDNLQKSILNERTDQSKPGVSSWEIFTNSNLRYKMLVFLFGWFSASIVYYSMSFNTKNVNGNPYLNVLYMGLVDFPAFFSGILFNNWLGRRKTYSGYCIFASIFLVALVVVDTVGGHDKYGLLLSIFSYMGRFGVCGAWGVLTCFTVESFPTTCRSTALGLCALAANFGGIIAPQLAYLGSLFPCAPYFVFAGLSLITACSTFLLGETNKKPLENFAK